MVSAAITANTTIGRTILATVLYMEPPSLLGPISYLRALQKSSKLYIIREAGCSEKG